MKKLPMVFLLIYVNGFSQCDSAFINKLNSYHNIPVQINHTNISIGWIVDQNHSDEFTFFDSNKWSKLPVGQCHSMSNYAYFEEENVTIENNHLMLRCHPDNTSSMCGHSMSYSSGWAGAKTNNTVQYGYFEIKCKMPPDNFLQPCFWMFGQVTGRYDEIDVNEYIIEDPSFENRLRQNIYHKESYTPYADTLGSAQLIDANFNQTVTNQWMTFAVEWFPYEINYYINGQISACAIYSTDIRTISPWNFLPPSEFCCINFANAIPQWIQFSLSLRGNPSNYDPYEIDYLRCYKLQTGNPGLYWPNYVTVGDPNLSKVHHDIKIGGDASHYGNFSSNSQVNLWANNSITLDKGFQINTETLFTARIVNTNDACFLP